MRRAAFLGWGFACAGAGAGAYGLYALVARGAVTIDLGIGREVWPLRAMTRTIAAPPEVVYDVVAAPYLRRTPRAMATKLAVWERGSDMALAAHFTPVGRGRTTTVEAVRFTPPERIDFRLVRGPVPHVRETFALHATDAGTELAYTGEIGTDLWGIGRWWGRAVTRHWERTVEASLDGIRAESERRAAARPSHDQ